MTQELFATQVGSYSAELTRRAMFAQYARTAANSPGIITGGLVAAGDLALSAPVSGMSVNVGAGECILGGTSGGAQGGYYGRNTAQQNISVAAANATNPRIDTVVATVADAGYTQPSDVGGTANGLVLAVITGTPTAGATLANLNGAAAVPFSSLVLGYVLVPANATNIITADLLSSATVVRSGIPGSSGEWSYTQITSNVSVVSTTESAGTTIIAPGAFTPDGLPMLVEFFAPFVQTTAGNTLTVCLFEGPTQIGRLGIFSPAAAAGTTVPFVGSLRFTPTSASHTYTITAFINAAGGAPLVGAGVGGTGAYSPAFVRFTKV